MCTREADGRPTGGRGRCLSPALVSSFGRTNQLKQTNSFPRPSRRKLVAFYLVLQDHNYHRLAKVCLRFITPNVGPGSNQTFTTGCHDQWFTGTFVRGCVCGGEGGEGGGVVVKESTFLTMIIIFGLVSVVDSVA